MYGLPRDSPDKMQSEENNIDLKNLNLKIPIMCH